MKNPLLVSMTALPLALCALDLSDKADIRFAESYAFSTNRAEQIATLRPESKAWFAYSILNAETEGRFKDAHALLDRWEREGQQYDRTAFNNLLARLTFHEWGRNLLDDPAARSRLLRTLKRCCGIDVAPREREVPLAPNTYPSRLDQNLSSFAAFWKDVAYEFASGLDENFVFLPVIGEKECADAQWTPNGLPENFLYDAPGTFEALRTYLLSDKGRDLNCLKDLPLDTLARLAESLKGTACDLRSSEHYAQVVLAKLAPGADDDPNDYLAAVELAKKRLAFVVANDVTEKGAGFGTDTNRVTFVRSDGSVKRLASEEAEKILTELSSMPVDANPEAQNGVKP